MNIRFENVSMRYPPGSPVLEDITFELESGSFHFLCGPSGAGKSSLLGLLSLSRKPDSGTIHMFGKEVSSLSRDALPHLRRRVGMVFQDFQLLDHMTVAQNIALPLHVAGETQKDTKEKVESLLEWIGMENLRNNFPPTLSGGQKQKVAIARAVINKPDLLLADEPTGNLDPALSLKFLYLFEQLNQDGTTIVIATHDESLLARFNRPVLRLKDSHISLSPALPEKPKQPSQVQSAP